MFGGKRASDRGVPAPASYRRDRALEQAIARDRIILHFQPQIDPVTGHVAGVEALARWSGVAGPEELFARAERARLSERLSRTIQRKALRVAGRWTGALAQLNLSINLLPMDLERPGFERWLLDEIAAAGLNPERITVEIVESSLVADPPAVAARLSCLRAAGVRIAIDDFGTGYSSLAYLTSLPIDTIKIDRALIADIVGGSRDRIVVKAMISLARELGGAFDAFDDHLVAEFARQGDHRLDDNAVARAADDIGDKRAVDLDCVDRQRGQIGKA